MKRRKGTWSDPRVKGPMSPAACQHHKPYSFSRLGESAFFNADSFHIPLSLKAERETDYSLCPGRSETSQLTSAETLLNRAV